MEQDEKTLQYIYQRGLKEEIKNKIMRHKYYTNTDN